MSTENGRTPNLRLIDALLGVATGNSSHVDETTQAADDSGGLEHTQRDLPTISYAIREQATLMNSWEERPYGKALVTHR